MKRLITPLSVQTRLPVETRLSVDTSSAIKTGLDIKSQKLISVRLPGSKYIANRLLPLCALASSSSLLTNIVDNDDIKASTTGLRALGYQLNYKEGVMSVNPRNSDSVHPENIQFNTHHSGTFSRFVTAIASLESTPVQIDCSAKMATRPMKELFDALRELGVEVNTENDKLPAIINGPIKNNVCQLDASRSSQYLSALLIIAPLLQNGLTINLIGKQVSSAYVDMTIDLMDKMGVSVKKSNCQITVEAGQNYKGIEYCVPCDPVSSSYFMGLSAITGQTIRIEAFDHNSLQGESQFYTVLEKMGVRFAKDESSLTIYSNGQLKGVEVDMGEMPDAVQTLAVIASYAKGNTLIKNIAHLAFKESDRIKDTATELNKAGIKVEAGDDYLLIYGGQPKAVEIDTYDDHRMAMSMALLGAKTDNVVINDSNVVNKSFPSYWNLMASVGLRSNELCSKHSSEDGTTHV